MSDDTEQRPPTRTAPRAPSGLGARASSLWRAVAKSYVLRDDEWAVMVDVCREVDLIDALSAVLVRDGITTAGSTGQTRVHPAVTELRQHRALLASLLRHLDLPDLDEPAAVERDSLSPASRKATRAARARWDKRGQVS